VHVVTPDVDAMSPYQDGVRVGVLVHGLLEEFSQVLFVGRVLDDGDPERVVVAQVAALLEALAEALDLLNVVDEELAAALLLQDQGHQDGPVRVRVDTAPGAALGEGS